MRTIIRSVCVVLTLLTTACAAVREPPSTAERQDLAPTGSLRVGVYPGSPVSMIRDAKSGEARGLSVELGKELASRLSLPLDLVELAKLTDVIDALKDGRIDLMITNASPARAQDMDFSPPLVEIEQGYLVVTGSRVSTLADVDQVGVRVGVVRGSSSQAALPQQLRSAAIVLAPTLKAATEMLKQKTIDVFATQKAILYEIADELPGSRVLEGRYGLEQIAIGIPKGRTRAMTYLRRFVEESKSDGGVMRAIVRAPLRGAAVAPIAR